MNVLFAAFEAVPFMKTGGLGDVAGSLPEALNGAGCDARVIMPNFSGIPQEYRDEMTHLCDFYVPLAWRNLYCGIETLTRRGVTYYFVDNEYYFNRGSAYGYFDDGERIAFFSKAVVEAIQYLPDFPVDILHANDWHTALSPVFLREFYRGIEAYDRIKTVFTVHNLKFQGQMSDYVLADVLGLAGIPAAADQLRMDKDSIDFMKGALCYSDVLTTVSPTYTEEVQRPFFGEHLDGIFRRRSNVLYGVMNGIDYSEWDPSTDPYLVNHFSKDDLSGKAAQKRALQEELGLDVDENIPLIVMIGRLTEQKGLDLVARVIEEMLYKPVQLAVLGTGDAKYEDMLRYYAWKFPGRMSACVTFDNSLSHRMYAGADMLLMPSLFEPCGLSQMIAMRYGTLPVVRETGGLKDSVIPYNQYTGEGTGFSFANYNAHEMLYTVQHAADLFRSDKDVWKKLQTQAMEADFSWAKAAKQYVDIYVGLQPDVEPGDPEPVKTEEKPKKAPAKKPAAEKKPTAEKKAATPKKTAAEKKPAAKKPAARKKAEPKEEK
ncbi:MAG: glycogen synthase GlgA [Oscillospiraceae bacterium]|nr:glycogen synthase GlgA [Oscillospiraceae bacterium]